MEAASARLAEVVFVLGATGTGKSKLAIELSTRFSGEVINSDKIQVYQGMDVVTNKVTAEEESLVRHHLLNVVDDPDADFTADDFRHEVVRAVESIISQGKVPIIAGGSNSYIEALVDEDFRRKYQTCFFWLDVELTVLHTSVSRRVDRMVEGGLVEEVRTAFHPEGDYSRGIRRAIGVPEMDRYFRAEAHLEPAARAILLAEAIDEIKANTCKLTCSQRGKILKFRDHLRWAIHRLDATEVFLSNGAEAEEAWEALVLRPAEGIARRFLTHDRQPNAVGPVSMAEEAIITSAVPLVVGALGSPVE
ncbi:adenylate isopentenyltransferase 5, chloroplastic-like [Aristolochia californica]|uniref:adenylate isopentenyltransferase 5, chloroplastic-like n=1 Tax=Aristolochia californica TaxID=171875 RepID=UPI0035E38E4D